MTQRVHNPSKQTFRTKSLAEQMRIAEIVIFERSAVAGVIASALLFPVLMTKARAQDEFIVTGDKLINSRDPNEFVRLGERIPIVQLKRRFARYKVRSTAYEVCNICAVVSKNGVQFEVDCDENGIVVTGIFCRDEGCVDGLGNQVGGSLRQALGNEADCDA